MKPLTPELCADQYIGTSVHQHICTYVCTMSAVATAMPTNTGRHAETATFAVGRTFSPVTVCACKTKTAWNLACDLVCNFCVTGQLLICQSDVWRATHCRKVL